jgi:hypothetical protein
MRRGPREYSTRLVNGRLRKLEVVKDNRRRSWKGALILSGVVLLATIAGMVFAPRERVLLEVGAMLAGLGGGAWLTRFGVSRQWIGSVVLVLFVAVCVVLGSSGYAWFGGFFAGTLAGVAWGRALANRTVQVAAPWTVDAEGFVTVGAARSAAVAALRSLDGKKSGRLSVDRGSARFEVAGGVGGEWSVIGMLIRPTRIPGRCCNLRRPRMSRWKFRWEMCRGSCRRGWFMSWLRLKRH